MNNFEKNQIVITIDTDYNVQNPNNTAGNIDGQWTLLHFNRNKIDDSDIDTYLDESDGKLLGLRRKLKVGLAFVIYDANYNETSYRIVQHNTIDDIRRNPSVYGLLIWEHKPSDMGAKSYEDRMEDASNFLDIYNDWANGRGIYATATYIPQNAITAEFGDIIDWRDHIENSDIIDYAKRGMKLGYRTGTEYRGIEEIEGEFNATLYESEIEIVKSAINSDVLQFLTNKGIGLNECNFIVTGNYGFTELSDIGIVASGVTN
jgi:hypothetical protein